MINLQDLDMDTLIGKASITAINGPLTRQILSFGHYGKDIVQVQTLIKDIGGSEARTETDFYFIPTSEIDKALIVAKAMATLDFMNLPYPLMSERVPSKEEPKNVVVPETESEVSEEVGSETSEDQEPAKPVDKKPRKRGPNKAKAIVDEAELELPPVIGEEPPAVPKNAVVGDLYDTNKQAHKDALILLLDKSHVGWRNMGKEKSKAMSAALIGQPFLDNAGVVLPHFKSLVDQHVKASLE